MSECDRLVNSWYTCHCGKMCLPIDLIHKVADGDTERAIAPFVVSALALPIGISNRLEERLSALGVAPDTLL